MESFSIKEIISDGESSNILNILNNTKKFDSKGQIRRLIQQGAIKLNGQKVEKAEELITLNQNGENIIKAGKKIFFNLTP